MRKIILISGVIPIYLNSWLHYYTTSQFFFHMLFYYHLLRIYFSHLLALVFVCFLLKRFSEYAEGLLALS
jgi:hypothetical protein